MDESLKKEFYWGVPCILLLFALGRMPSWYYEFLRLIIFVASIYYVIENKKISGMEIYVILFVVSAIIYNPIIPIYLYDKGLWMVINLLTLFLFAIGAYSLKEKILDLEQKTSTNHSTPEDTDSLQDLDDLLKLIKEDKLSDEELKERTDNYLKKDDDEQSKIMAKVREMSHGAVDFQLIASGVLDTETIEKRLKSGQPLIPEYISDGYVFGYLFGYHDGIHQLMLPVDDINYMASGAIFIDYYLGNEGLSILGRSEEFETAKEDDTFAMSYKKGRYAARLDVDQARAGKGFMSLQKYLMGVDKL